MASGVCEENFRKKGVIMFGVRHQPPATKKNNSLKLHGSRQVPLASLHSHLHPSKPSPSLTSLAFNIQDFNFLYWKIGKKRHKIDIIEMWSCNLAT